MGDFLWIFRGATWALLRNDPLRSGQTIVQYIRWSESAHQYVDMYGKDLGENLDQAKTKVELAALATVSLSELPVVNREQTGAIGTPSKGCESKPFGTKQGDN